MKIDILDKYQRGQKNFGNLMKEEIILMKYYQECHKY